MATTVRRGPGRDGRAWLRLAEKVRALGLPCGLCGQEIDYSLPKNHPWSFTVEHVLPLSLYPELAEDPTNLTAAHRWCNSSRGNGTKRKRRRTSKAW